MSEIIGAHARRNGLIGGVLALAVLGYAAWHAQDTFPAMPQARDTHDAQPWMADTLPGVGPKSRLEVSAALRRGDVAALPSTAQRAFAERFLPLSDPRQIQPDEKDTIETK